MLEDFSDSEGNLWMYKIEPICKVTPPSDDTRDMCNFKYVVNVLLYISWILGQRTSVWTWSFDRPATIAVQILKQLFIGRRVSTFATLLVWLSL